MSTQWQALAEQPLQSAEEMRRRLTDKATTDDDFRAALMSDPRSAVSKELGLEIPEGLDIQVHESDMSTVHLALPPSAMNEEQLEAIAAGRCCC